jgi:cytochrome c biogenesis protein CcmG, thiol:disulfide interchange protein DsbE
MWQRDRMKGRRGFGSVAVVAIVIVLGGLIWLNRDRFTPLDVGSRAPDYAALDLAGDTVLISSFTGNVVLLNIWATWCLPCVREMPALQRLHEELAPQGLRIVAVSVDAPRGALGAFGQPGGDVHEFRERFGITFTVLQDPSGRIQSRYQVNGLPTTFIIDRDGRIRRKHLGAAEWDEPAFADAIRRVLEG